MNSPLTTHVLDTTSGRPAAGISVQLERLSKSGAWKNLSAGITDADGRINSLLAREVNLAEGTYRLTFDVAAYFRALKTDSFYTDIPIVFNIQKPEQHVHVPLLLSPYSYATYRGS